VTGNQLDPAPGIIGLPDVPQASEGHADGMLRTMPRTSLAPGAGTRDRDVRELLEAALRHLGERDR